MKTGALLEDWRAWLALRMIRGVGPVVYQALLRAFDHPGVVFNASAHALECAGVRPEVARTIRAFNDWAMVDKQLQRLEQSGATVSTWYNPSYPANLREIHDPPPFLFVRGALQPRDTLAVAVVGSRNVSAYGLRMTREIAEGLVRYGVTVVSGLARGTDAAAHWATLRAGGRTIAVLGSGIDVVYPSEHHELFRAIASQGAVVTELLPGTQPDAENFPNRNRIISGLAFGTVIVEAAEKSGSLITATLAADQGREVFAVPGAVSERTRGTHRLLRQGAKLTERAEDVLEEIAPQLLRQAAPRAAVALERNEAAVVACMRHDTLHIDAITARSGLTPAGTLQVLLALELKGVVQQLPGKHFVATVVDLPRHPAKE
ncbi:MAG: DNA-processing protein DprA [Candidatus Binatia bacterium]